MDGYTILLINAIFFSLVTIFYYMKSKGVNIGVFMLLFYSICAWGALLYHQNELFQYFRGKETYHIVPFIYLDFVILLFFTPLLYLKTNQCNRIEYIDINKYYKWLILIIIIQLSLYIVLLPSVLKAVLVSDIGDFRNEQYGEAEVIQFPNYFFNILCRVYMGFRNIALLLSAYLLVVSKKHKRILVLFFVLSVFFPVYYYMAFASRSASITQFAFCIFIVLALRPFIAKKVQRRLIIYLSAFAVPVVSIYTYISQSRFGILASYMFYRYLGESFNNYNTEFFYDIKGHTWGTAYFSFFQKVFGSEVAFKGTDEKWDYISNLTNIDAHVFYTFVGGLNIEFGFIIPIIIGIIIAYYSHRLYKRQTRTMTLSKFLLCGMFGYFLINGAFMFVLQGDSGVLEIFFTIIFVIYFKRKQISNNFISINN